MKLKARSRLRPSNTPLFSHQKFSGIAISVKTIFNNNGFLDQAFWTNWLKIRLNKIPQLIIGLTSYFFSWQLISNFYPIQLQNWFLPNSYVAVIGLLAISHLYFFSFFTLKPKFSFLLSLILSWLLWLKLHQFEIDIPTLLMTIGVASVISLVTQIFKK